MRIKARAEKHGHASGPADAAKVHEGKRDEMGWGGMTAGRERPSKWRGRGEVLSVCC